MAEREILVERPNKVVYKEGDKVIKCFNKVFPKSDVLNEALNQARVEETGLPIPKILGVTTSELGEWTIITEAIEGKTLEQIMKEDSSNIESYMEQFVDIQLSIHAKSCPLLNKLKDKLDGRIAALKSQGVSPSVRYELRSSLSNMPTHAKVLHGDFNPSNIMITREGKAYIIDWAHAAQGNASADAANTYILFLLHNPEMADRYLDLFSEKCDTAKQYVEQWIPIMAAARLAKAVPDEKEMLMKWISGVGF